MCEAVIKMLGSLSFESVLLENEDVNQETPCFLCDDRFNLQLSFKIFLQHCLQVHNLVIEDVQHIENLHEYVSYWRKKFDEEPFESIIPSIRMDDGETKYYVLSTLLKEDGELRHRLKLNKVMEVQEFERMDSMYKRNCLFCRLEFEGLRSDYLNHLSTTHNLHLGNPQNLVYVDEFINEIDEKLKNFICIYCEGKFPDRTILKEHMRKKLHKSVNPQNKKYDKFYIVNYLEVNKRWDVIEKEDDNFPIQPGENSDTEYSDWNESEHQIICLFCTYKNTKIEEIQKHMSERHTFDFKGITEELNFYQKVKLVNYIRRQILNFHCICCDRAFSNDAENKEHMIAEQHCKIPEVATFDLPEFFFSTYDNDSLLYLLEDVED